MLKSGTVARFHPPNNGSTSTSPVPINVPAMRAMMVTAKSAKARAKASPWSAPQLPYAGYSGERDDRFHRNGLNTNANEAKKRQEMEDEALSRALEGQHSPLAEAAASPINQFALSASVMGGYDATDDDPFSFDDEQPFSPHQRDTSPAVAPIGPSPRTNRRRNVSSELLKRTHAAERLGNAADDDELDVLDKAHNSLVDPNHPSHVATVAVVDGTVGGELLTQEAADMVTSKTKRAMKRQKK
jgi:hypothetical protein